MVLSLPFVVVVLAVAVVAADFALKITHRHNPVRGRMRQPAIHLDCGVEDYLRCVATSARTPLSFLKTTVATLVPRLANAGT